VDILRTVDDCRRWRLHTRRDVGFVPTMGYLHDGHLSLVRASRARDAVTAASIFVNPTQFGPNEDFARYPRDEDRDLALLSDAGVAAVFIPSVDEMYPGGFATYVHVERLTERLEGASRPAHFRGVTTIVLKLLNIIQPHRAYFGQKDAQQLAVVRRMVCDLDVPVEIVACPIVREPDGLAMSSRNVYLSPEERRAALVLSRALRLAEQRYADGERDAAVIRAAVEREIAAEALARLDYVSVAHPDTLEELDSVDGAALVSVAARFGTTRLIDNTLLGASAPAALDQRSPTS
jgi:pantoate--beta-alanine ligase